MTPRARVVPRLLLVLVAVVAAGLATGLAAGAARAQDQAALVADKITVLAGNELRAEGHVEVLYKGMRLRATAITYNAARDRITIEGPMSLSQGDGFILLADQGALDADFQNGVLESARLVLDQQLQVAASEIRRIDGRYTQLFRVVASTCPVCSGSDTPLWQIRARRAVHDAERKRMYYYDALFEIGGLPVFYVPRLRMPDGSVNRATGFLAPSLTNLTTLGLGPNLPYYIAINDQSDATLTPFVTAKTKTLGFDYRTLVRRGALAFTGAVSRDDLRPDGLRGYLFARSVYFLPRDFELRFNIEMSSDDSYLFDYGISSQDRLHSDITLSRVRRETFTQASVSRFVSFRDNETASTSPSLIGQLDQVHRFTLPVVGGEASYALQGFGLVRSSTVDVVGRDYARLSGTADWTRSAVFGPGFLVQGETRFSFDAYDISGDSTVPSQSHLTSVGGLSLSWPQARQTPGGAREILEPKAQLVFTDAQATSIPNEESTLVEFDEGNLFSLDRLPGSSAYELGNHANLGVTWTRFDPAGWHLSLTAGQVFRHTDTGQFDSATGLRGYASDALLSGQLSFGNGFMAASRFLINGSRGVDRNDTRLSWSRGDFGIDGAFLWQIAEPEIGRDLDTWELYARTRFPLGRSWRGRTDLRYDFIAGRAAAAGLNLVYEGQCLVVDLGATRTFTSSDAVTPQTQIKISLSVPQGTVANKRPKLQCGG